MNRDEAEKLVGTRVSALTARSGLYVGVLLAVITPKGRRWRGVVRIDGVLDVACHYDFERGVTVRRGFRTGEDIEVSGLCISPCDLVGASYKEALEVSIAKQLKWHDGNPHSAFTRAHQLIARAQQQILRCERARLKTGKWRLHQFTSAAVPRPRATASVRVTASQQAHAQEPLKHASIPERGQPSR